MGPGADNAPRSHLSVLLEETRMAIADGPGSPSEDWLDTEECWLQRQEQGLLAVVLATVARADVDQARIDLALKVGQRE